MKILKFLIVSVFAGLIAHVGFESFYPTQWKYSEIACWLAVFSGAFFGGYLARFVSWGWLLGGALGFLAGFYGLLVLLAAVWPDRTYEDGLWILLLGAFVGLVSGGYGLSRVCRKCVSGK